MSKTTTWKNKSPIPESNTDKNDEDLNTFRDNQPNTTELDRDFNYKNIPTMDSPTMDSPTMDSPTMDSPTMDSPTMDSPIREGMRPAPGRTPEQTPEKVLGKNAKVGDKIDSSGKTAAVNAADAVMDRVVNFLANGDDVIAKEVRKGIDTIAKDCSWFIGIGNSISDAAKKSSDGIHLGKLIMLLFMCIIYSIILLPSLILFAIKFTSLVYMIFLRRAVCPGLSSEDFQKAVKLNESYFLNVFSIFIGLFITLNWWYIIGYKTTYIDFAQMISSVPPLNFMFEHAFVSLHLFNYLTSARINIGSPFFQSMSAFCWHNRPLMFFFLLSFITAIYANGGSQINSSFMSAAAQNAPDTQSNNTGSTTKENTPSVYEGINIMLVFMSFLMLDLFNIPRLMFRMKTFMSAIITGILLLVKLLFAIMLAGTGIHFALMMIVIYSFAGLFVADFNVDIFTKINIIFIDLHNTIEETDDQWSYGPWALYRVICNNLISVYLFIFVAAIFGGNIVSILAHIDGKGTNLQTIMLVSNIIIGGIVLSYLSIWKIVEPYIKVLFQPFVERVFGTA